MSETCGECRFWWSWEAIGVNGYGSGECRRFPPAVVMLPKSVGGDTDRATPVTGKAYWCGEFQPHRAAANSGENAA